jgi:hypothetical protein
MGFQYGKHVMCRCAYNSIYIVLLFIRDGWYEDSLILFSYYHRVNIYNHLQQSLKNWQAVNHIGFSSLRDTFLAVLCAICPFCFRISCTNQIFVTEGGGCSSLPFLDVYWGPSKLVKNKQSSEQAWNSGSKARGEKERRADGVWDYSWEFFVQLHFSNYVSTSRFSPSCSI